jgi:hypothetical protein
VTAADGEDNGDVRLSPNDSDVPYCTGRVQCIEPTLRWERRVYEKTDGEEHHLLTPLKNNPLSYAHSIPRNCKPKIHCNSFVVYWKDDSSAIDRITFKRFISNKSKARAENLTGISKLIALSPLMINSKSGKSENGIIWTTVTHTHVSIIWDQYKIDNLNYTVFVLNLQMMNRICCKNVIKFHLPLILSVACEPLPHSPFSLQQTRYILDKTEGFSSHGTLVDIFCGREQHNAVYTLTSSQAGDNVLWETLLGDCLVGAEVHTFISTSNTYTQRRQTNRFKETALSKQQSETSIFTLTSLWFRYADLKPQGGQQNTDSYSNRYSRDRLIPA